VWDIGGQYIIRKLWRHYYENTDALIFVVDSSDPERIELAKEELHGMLGDEAMQDAAVLVFANKMDSGIMSVSEVSEKMGMHLLKGREWNIQGTCALTGEGLTEGLEWMSKTVKNKKSKSSSKSY
jgi:GTPase SAR1 family protein